MYIIVLNRYLSVMLLSHIYISIFKKCY